MRGGGIVGVWQLAGAGAAPETLDVTRPPTLETLAPAVAVAGGAGVELELRGVGVHEPECKLLARSGGVHVPVQVTTYLSQVYLNQISQHAPECKLFARPNGAHVPVQLTEYYRINAKTSYA